MENTRFYITTGREVVVHEAGIRKAPREYATCDAALAVKPTVRLHTRSVEELQKLYTLIAAGTAVDGPDYPTVLYSLIDKYLRDKCSEEFVACGLRIALADEVMSACAFVSVERTPQAPPVGDANLMTDEIHQKVLMARLLSSQRVSMAEGVKDPDGSYKTRVIRQIEVACAKASIIFKGCDIAFAGRFSVSQDYMRLLCCADMFFIKFPKHSLSSLKVGTLTMSFKDMSQCNNLAYMENLTGQRWPSMICYTYEVSLLNELMAHPFHVSITDTSL